VFGVADFAEKNDTFSNIAIDGGGVFDESDNDFQLFGAAKRREEAFEKP